MVNKIDRKIIGCFGFILPSLWFVVTVGLFAWYPRFCGSFTVFVGVLGLSFGLTGIAVLTAPIRWHRRLLCVFPLWLLLMGQVGIILGRAYFSMDIGTRQRPVRIATDWMKPLASEWGMQSPGKHYSIQSVSEFGNANEDSLRFELRKGELYADLFGKTSHRTEVNVRDFPPIGSIRWYGFSLLLPRDFPIENNRLVLAQWHGADKKYLGEPSRSPALAFRYSDGRFFITIRHSPERIVRTPGAVPSETLFETRQFPLGNWNDFRVHAKWSCCNDGFVRIWWNERPIVQYAGPVGYNDDFGPYFKFGIYRDDTEQTYVVYFNQVKIGEQIEDVKL